MIIVILLLAVDGAVHYDMAVIALDLSRFVADWTDSERGYNIRSDCDFVWNKVLIVATIWLSTEAHKELCNVNCSSHCCGMQRCVAFIICDVWSCPTVKQEPQYIVLRVVSRSLE